MISGPNYNRALLGSLFFREYRTKKGGWGMVVDGSSLRFLIEEFISLAVTDIAVDEHSNASSFLDQLDSERKERIVIVKNQKVLQQRRAIISPLAEEYDINIDSLGFSAKKVKTKELHSALSKLYFDLYMLLMGIEHKLQIDINLNALDSAISTIRSYSRNPRARTNLAILAGLVHVYKKITLGTVAVNSQNIQKALEYFFSFTEDETYKLMSYESYLIGFPDRVDRARITFGRLARKLSKNPVFMGICKLTSRSITAATEFPIPDIDAFSFLVSERFLPPIISTKNVVLKAKKNWKLAKPNLIAPEGFSESEENIRLMSMTLSDYIEVDKNAKGKLVISHRRRKEKK